MPPTYPPPPLTFGCLVNLNFINQKKSNTQLLKKNGRTTRRTVLLANGVAEGQTEKLNS